MTIIEFVEGIKGEVEGMGIDEVKAALLLKVEGLSEVEKNGILVDCLAKMIGMKRVPGEGRKEELRKWLLSGERYSVKELGEKMCTTVKNVSTLLSYLKKDGLRICIDSEGKRFVEKIVED